MADLLIVDDEPLIVEHYARHFERSGHEVRRAGCGASALRAYRERRPDVIILDLRLPDMSGLDVLDQLRDEGPLVIMVSGQADVANAVRAVQGGVFDFLTKPVDLAQLSLALDRALEHVRVRQLARWFTARRESTGRIPIGSSPRMQELASQVELLAAAQRTPVMITGESGTGKGRVAELIHAHSPRAERPFIEVSCAAHSAESLERELFGVEDALHAFDRPSLFELAAGGTLFLDEVGALPPTLQPKLLRFLEGRPFRRTGGTREIACDVRIVAATNKDLVAEVTAGRFREDLYYRLSVMPLHLPPLRARAREDLVELIGRLMDDLAPSLPEAPRSLDEGALAALLRYAWPGNIRELRNVLERAMIVGRGAASLALPALPNEVRSSPQGWDDERPEGRSLAEVERAHIERTLRAHDGNRTHAARELGISRATLIKKIREYSLTPAP